MGEDPLPTVSSVDLASFRARLGGLVGLRVSLDTPSLRKEIEASVCRYGGYGRFDQGGVGRGLRKNMGMADHCAGRGLRKKMGMADHCEREWHSLCFFECRVYYVFFFFLVLLLLFFNVVLMWKIVGVSKVSVIYIYIYIYIIIIGKTERNSN